MNGVSLFRRFGQDRGGVSAVEFALIAPLLILAYVGLVHVTLALSADRKITSAAGTVADLIAQNDTVDSAIIADAIAAGQAIVQPFSADPLQVRVTSIRSDAGGAVHFVWGDARGTAPRSAGDMPPLPPGVLLPEGGVVVVEVSYPFETPFSGVKFGNFNFTETAYMRPRRSQYVAMDTTQNNNPTVPDSGGTSGGGTGGSDPGAQEPPASGPGNNGRGRGRGGNS